MRGRTLICGLMVLAFGAGGCSPGQSKLANLQDEMARGQKMAGNCLRDTLHVPLQNSAHCLATASHLRKAVLMKDCWDQKTLQCDKLQREQEFTYTFYTRAVAMSLYAHGLPKEFKPAQKGSQFGFSQFYDEVLLSQAYANCLAEEKAARSRALRATNWNGGPSAVRVTSVSLFPLAPGQLCIREDYAAPFREAEV
jgi:hypothetical protein